MRRKKYYLKRYPHVFYMYLHGRKRYGFRYTYNDIKNTRHEISRRGFSSLGKTVAKLDDIEHQMHYRCGKISYDPTLYDWANSFIYSNQARWKPSTFQAYVSVFRSCIFPYLAKFRVRELNKTLYQRRVINPLIARGLKHNTIMDAHHRMVAVMNAAVDDGIIARNKLTRVTIPLSTGKVHKRIMTEKELSMFNRQLKHEDLRYQVIFRVLEDTGMREGELLGLKWRDVDLGKDRIHIRHTRDVNGYRSPKTQHSRRTIGISVELGGLLERYRRKQTKIFNAHHAAQTKDSFVITDKQAYPLSNTSISRNLGLILERAGLSYLKGHFTAHTFRHMFASYLLNSNYPLADVSRALGHANPQITLEIYTEKRPGKVENFGKDIEKLYKKR